LRPWQIHAGAHVVPNPVLRRVLGIVCSLRLLA
jgi:hypothetical protein